MTDKETKHILTQVATQTRNLIAKKILEKVPIKFVSKVIAHTSRKLIQEPFTLTNFIGNFLISSPRQFLTSNLISSVLYSNALSEN